MKLMFINGWCQQWQVNADPVREIWRQAWNRDEYVFATFRLQRESGKRQRGEVKENLDLLAVLQERGLINIFAPDVPTYRTMRMETPSMVGPATIRIIPLDLSFLETHEWHSLKYDLLSLESETSIPART